MADHREEVPTWAIINALIVEKAVQTKDFARCAREVEEIVKVAPGSLANKFFTESSTTKATAIGVEWVERSETHQKRVVGLAPLDPPYTYTHVFPNAGLSNSAYTVSLLYCLIVVPKEVWLLSENHPVYASIDKDWLLPLFNVEFHDDRFTKHPVYSLIHHLRNAIAHARFSIDDDGMFTFWDQKNAASAPRFRASASAESLGQFAAKVGNLFAELRRGLSKP